MNKETFTKLKKERNERTKPKRDPLGFLRLWLTSKPVAKEQKLSKVIPEVRLGHKFLFKNRVLKMWRRGVSGNQVKLTPAQMKNKKEDYENAVYRELFTRRQWNQMRTNMAIAKNKEAGLNRYGFPIRNGKETVSLDNV